MKSKLIILITLMGFAVLFSSCAKYPQQQFDATTASIKDAKDAGADVYTPEVYQALVDSMNSATVKAEAAKAKTFSNYTQVNELLVVTADNAVKAKANVEVRKTELKSENDSLIVEVKALVVTDKELLAKAPKGKDGKAALAAIETELSVVETTIAEAETLSATDLVGANSKLKVSKDKALSIKTELEGAIEKVKTI